MLLLRNIIALPGIRTWSIEGPANHFFMFTIYSNYALIMLSGSPLHTSGLLQRAGRDLQEGCFSHLLPSCGPRKSLTNL